jgi:uncharacterized protein
MVRTLKLRSTLETLKKEAKRWLKALQAGDANARRRLLAATPTAPDTPTLRDVQLALAHEYGFAGWSALRQALDDLALARRSHAERVEMVMRSAKWGGDRITATRLLVRWPEIGADNLYTAVMTGNLAEVQRRLAADPAAARTKGGPLDWEPLLYLAYANLPGGEKHGLEIARALLDHGADPNARWVGEWGEPAFTVLTGLIGEGEAGKPPHPDAAALSSLLVERGADPFDPQALYNISLISDNTVWLERLWALCEQRGKLSDWTDASRQPKIGGTVPVNALDYLLGNAVAANHLQRAEWLLGHGANPNSLHAYSKLLLRQEALVHGHRAMAELLVRYGAGMVAPEGQAAFQAACMALDRDGARVLAGQHPQYLQDASPMLTAAGAGRADVVALLLELGMDVDIADTTLLRGLQSAVRADSIEVVKLLVAHGADIDRPTLHHGGAMGFAAFFQRRAIAAFLAPLSRDLPNLTYLGMFERLSELFAEDPGLVSAIVPKWGGTLLFALPDDEEKAAEITAFLLAQGADPRIRSNTGGSTPEQAARERGLEDAADLMREAAL